MPPGSGFGRTNFRLLIVPLCGSCHYNYQHTIWASGSLSLKSLCMRPHVPSYLLVFVSMLVCSHLVCHCTSVPSVCFCSSVFVCCCSHRSHLLLLLLPAFLPSLSVYLPHRLPITLHKARITQATPFHLLSSSSLSSFIFLLDSF